MLDLANDIRSLSDFKRNTADLLTASGKPVIPVHRGSDDALRADVAITGAGRDGCSVRRCYA